MAGLKYELDQWNEGVIAFDEGLYEEALEIFEPIADSAKIHFNIGVVLATLGDFEGASAAYTQATKLDQYLAIAYFQNGVANVALEDYGKALTCFHDAYLYLRGNMVIDYTQLGLDFKLYSCQVLLNRALCYIELGDMDLGMTDLWRATREKQTKAHDVLDQALRDRGQDCTVFTVPQGVLYRPPESKVKNSKKKDYLGNSKVIAALDTTDSFAGFQGVSAWQVQMTGPMGVAEERPQTPPGGLQRRATERNMQSAGGNRSRSGTNPERPTLEHANSFNGMEPGMRRANTIQQQPMGAAGSDPRGSLLSRRNTDANRPSPLNLDGRSNTGGPSSAAAGGQGSLSNNNNNANNNDLDDLDKSLYAMTIESQEYQLNDDIGNYYTGASNNMNGNSAPPVPMIPNNVNERGVSPMPMRSNSRAGGAIQNNGNGGSYSGSNGLPPRSMPGSILRRPSQSQGPSPPPSVAGAPPLPRSNSNGNGNGNGAGRGLMRQDTMDSAGSYGSSPPQLGGRGGLAEQLRRAGSSAKGLTREGSMRGGPGSAASTGSSPLLGSAGYNGNGNGNGYYMEEPAYAGLRDKLRVKCHYTDTRAVLVRADTPIAELIQRVQEKFQTDRPLRMKYKDEDNHMLSMIDDEDWLMAQQVHMEVNGNLDRIELWCFDDD